jgi:cyclic pyranopterin phosphate synthase
MQANGRADTYFDQIFPSYTETAAAFRAFLNAVGESRPMAFLVDIPLCTTEGIPDFNRGYVEKHFHYNLEDHAILDGVNVEERRLEGKGRGLVVLSREDLDHAARSKRAECARCRYDAQCEGVWSNYVRRTGWDEFVPVSGPGVASPVADDSEQKR